MNIEKNAVVSLHYKLIDADGTLLEQSYNGDPVAHLQGHKGLYPAVEEALMGKATGDKLSVTLTPEQSYGDRRDDAEQRIPIKRLKNNKKPKIKQIVQFDTPNGQRQAVVLKVGRYNVDVDGNHPFAGKTITFEMEVIDVREASAEEISHGHAHGVGGHHH